MANKSQKDAPSHLNMPEFIDRFWVSTNRTLITSPPKTMVMDFSTTRTIDSAGISFIRVMRECCHKAGGQLILRNISRKHLSLIEAWPGNRNVAQPQQSKENLFSRTGSAAVQIWETIVNALSILTEMIYWGTIGAFIKRDMRKGSLGEQMYHLGMKAFFIVALLAFLIGVVLSLQTAMQLENFGAGVFLASLIGMSMVRELGPLMTAIILAGRTGSATTAEIATMCVGEEIDALKTMGINPIQFVVVPKFWAITITMPILSIIATATGIFGGYLIGLLYLDLGSSMFLNELAKSLKFRDVFAGVFKSVIFSWLIIWIGAFYGFRVRGGAEAVGKETTASVVTSIFIIIIADAIFSFIL
ncbi:MAG TPA: MlaE family lipid ABC transporter permease subunit [Chitinispirillaceae bacterium]|nr:MlaE family lipid ABC transporter permease subunit [Chitinispirillaceae bacterium]